MYIYWSVAVFSDLFILSVSAQRFFDQDQFIRQSDKLGFTISCVIFCFVHSICQFILSVSWSVFHDQLPHFLISLFDQSVDVQLAINCRIFWSVHFISQLICTSRLPYFLINSFYQSVDIDFSINCRIFWLVHLSVSSQIVQIFILRSVDQFIRSVSWSVFYDQLPCFLISSFDQSFLRSVTTYFTISFMFHDQFHVSRSADEILDKFRLLISFFFFDVQQWPINFFNDFFISQSTYIFQ